MLVFRITGWDVWTWLRKPLSRIKSRRFPKSLPESSKRRSDDAVARGDYAPGSVNLPERSEADWAKLMDQDADKSANNPGVVNQVLNNPRKV